jgi:DNA-binding HxlR family transcriptional regulator
MVLHEILSKKYAKEVILLLDGEDELYFTQLQKLTGAYKSNLSKLLKYLEGLNVISRRFEDESYLKKGVPRVYFKLTPRGKKIAKLLKKIDELEKELDLSEKSENSIVIKGNVSGNNIIIGGNSNVHIKK